MSPITVGILVIILMLAFLLLLEMPIGFAMGLAGAIGIFLISGTSPLFNIISYLPYTVSSMYILTSIPMFVLMGWFAAEARISTDLFVVANNWVGWLKGGLAMAVSLAQAAFGAVCGDSITTSITMAAIAYPEMKKRNYDPALATGVLASGGNLGFLIPPSIAFIIFGVITETSIGHLFMAGILPGILLALLFCGAVAIVCLVKPQSAPPRTAFNFRKAIRLPQGALVMVIIMLIVLGGIYFGVFTPTEAGGAGAFATMVFGFAGRRLPWRRFFNSLVYTVRTSGMIFILVTGAMIFSSALALSTIPFQLVDMIEGISISPYFILVAILVLYIILGFFLDIMSVLLILLPVTIPLTSAAGFDNVLVGVLTLITVSMGQVSPPVGILVFAVGGMLPEVPMRTIFRGVWPFFGAMAICLVILIAFPQISLIIPNTMFGT